MERGYSFASTGAMWYSRKLARDMKEKLCYVAVDFEQHMRGVSKDTSVERCYHIPATGDPITISHERFRCAELLFQPSLIGADELGVHRLLYNSVVSCEADIREDLFSNILLAGGTTLLPGFGERIRKELQGLCSTKTEVEIIGSSDRRYSSWIGGSLLAKNVDWVTKKEYDEFGPDIVHKKCI